MQLLKMMMVEMVSLLRQL